MTVRLVFFLKTNGMLRGRHDCHPVQRSKLSQKIADVFADAEEAELTAATVVERLNFLQEDALPHWRSVCRGMPLPGTGGRAPCGEYTVERGRGEPPTVHDPHTPVVRSVTHAHATQGHM